LSTKKKGDRGEIIALEYLTRLKYRILQVNYRLRFGEIDIICFDLTTDQFVFVEVKSLKNENRLAITQTISKTKAHRIKMAAQTWLRKNNLEYSDWRIDFIGVVLDNSSVVHLQAAIY